MTTLAEAKVEVRATQVAAAAFAKDDARAAYRAAMRAVAELRMEVYRLSELVEALRLAVVETEARVAELEGGS